MADNDEKIVKILESMDKRLDGLQGDVSDLKQGRARTETALDALKAGQDDIRDNEELLSQRSF